MFADDQRRGAKREQQFIDWTKRNKLPILDVREQFTSFDFVLQSWNKHKVKIEVKSWTKPEQLAIEENNVAIDGRDDVRPGWIYTTCADYLCFVSDEALLWVSVPKLRRWYDDNKYRYHLQTNRPSRIGGLLWQGHFRWVPIKHLPSRIFVVKKLVLNDK